MKEVNDYRKWFVSDSGTIIQCPKDSFKEYCKSIFGSEWHTRYKMFRRATFEEHCRFELDLIND